MIKFIYKHKGQEILTVENASSLFKKDILMKFSEAVTMQFKYLLLHKLEDIREELENGQTVVICNYNDKIEEFEFQYHLENDELSEKLGQRLKT